MFISDWPKSQYSLRTKIYRTISNGQLAMSKKTGFGCKATGAAGVSEQEEIQIQNDAFGRFPLEDELRVDRIRAETMDG